MTMDQAAEQTVFAAARNDQERSGRRPTAVIARTPIINIMSSRRDPIADFADPDVRVLFDEKALETKFTCILCV